MLINCTIKMITPNEVLPFSEKDIELLKKAEHETDEWLENNIKKSGEEYHWHDYYNSKLIRLKEYLRDYLLRQYRKEGWIFNFKTIPNATDGWPEYHLYVSTNFKR